MWLWISIIFPFSEQLEDLEEKRDDVKIEEDRTHDVVVHRDALVSASENQLGVTYQVDAVYDCEEGSDSSHNQTALKPENVNETDGKHDPAQRVADTWIFLKIPLIDSFNFVRSLLVVAA